MPLTYLWHSLPVQHFILFWRMTTLLPHCRSLLLACLHSGLKSTSQVYWQLMAYATLENFALISECHARQYQQCREWVHMVYHRLVAAYQNQVKVKCWRLYSVINVAIVVQITWIGCNIHVAYLSSDLWSALFPPYLYFIPGATGHEFLPLQLCSSSFLQLYDNTFKYDMLKNAIKFNLRFKLLKLQELLR